jgi:hypothetical protein
MPSKKCLSVSEEEKMEVIAFKLQKISSLNKKNMYASYNFCHGSSRS